MEGGAEVGLARLQAMTIKRRMKIGISRFIIHFSFGERKKIICTDFICAV
jgi:hypothetical protein